MKRGRRVDVRSAVTAAPVGLAHAGAVGPG